MSRRVLHLFANWKWTGPAEPAVLLASEQARRGDAVTFVPGRAPPGCDAQIAAEARAHALDVREGPRLPKHRRPLANLLDRGSLRAIVAEVRPDVVHVHSTNDHLAGVRAVGAAGSRALVVRSYYDADPPAGGSAAPFRRRADGVVVFGRAAEAALAERLGPRRVLRADPPTARRFFVDPPAGLPDLRGRWGLAPEDCAVGIVARVQTHRRWDLLLDAFERAARERPELRLVIIGRGTRFDELARGPSDRGGLRGRVVLAGYLRDDDYLGALHALDAKVFLVPGSDGTCRAAREAMACGVPVVATRRGLLPEIVADGETGLLIDETPAALAAALVRLAADRELRSALGSAAGRTARARFDPERYASAVDGFYGHVS